jgi:hypothetical protein
MADTQISAFISDTTKELVERYVKAHGVKKGHSSRRRCCTIYRHSGSCRRI